MGSIVAGCDHSSQVINITKGDLKKCSYHEDGLPLTVAHGSCRDGFNDVKSEWPRGWRR